MKPDYTEARFNLGGALARPGQLDEAIGDFREVLRVQRDVPGAAQALETCLELKKQPAH
jgi:hypothetical protein